MFGNHGVELVDRRVHVHGAHAIDVTVGRGEGLDALLEFTGEIQQPAARRDDREVAWLKAARKAGKRIPRPRYRPMIYQVAG